MKGSGVDGNVVTSDVSSFVLHVILSSHPTHQFRRYYWQA